MLRVLYYGEPFSSKVDLKYKVFPLYTNAVYVLLFLGVLIVHYSIENNSVTCFLFARIYIVFSICKNLHCVFYLQEFTLRFLFARIYIPFSISNNLHSVFYLQEFTLCFLFARIYIVFSICKNFSSFVYKKISYG